MYLLDGSLSMGARGNLGGPLEVVHPRQLLLRVLERQQDRGRLVPHAVDLGRNVLLAIRARNLVDLQKRGNAV